QTLASRALTRPVASFWPGQKAVWPQFWRAGLATWQTAPGDWRAGLALARSFPREGAGDKVLGGQSQNLVAYGLELREYFANLIANLAIWQSARSWRKPPVVASLHLVACNAVQRRAMQCRRGTCNACNVQRPPCVLAGGGGYVAGWHT